MNLLGKMSISINFQNAIDAPKYARNFAQSINKGGKPLANSSAVPTTKKVPVFIRQSTGWLKSISNKFIFYFSV